MWFEWIEIELMMQEPAVQSGKKLRWDHPVSLSPTARIKRLSYPVHDKRDDAKLLNSEKGEYPVLVYRELETNRVMFMETTPFMYKVLKKLKKGGIPKAAVKEIAKAYGEKYGEVAEIIRPVLSEFFAMGILI
jgi:hypothetical protein